MHIFDCDISLYTLADKYASMSFCLLFKTGNTHPLIAKTCPQNHRISWVGRNLKSHLFPILLSWAGGTPYTRPGCPKPHSTRSHHFMCRAPPLLLQKHVFIISSSLFLPYWKKNIRNSPVYISLPTSLYKQTPLILGFF